MVGISLVRTCNKGGLEAWKYNLRKLVLLATATSLPWWLATSSRSRGAISVPCSHLTKFLSLTSSKIYILRSYLYMSEQL